MDAIVWNAILGTLVVLMVITALAGNLFVCFAIQSHRRLRKRENLFVVSLAMSDLLVAFPVMVLTGVKDIQGSWPFGELLCNLLVATDITSSTASILNLCALALVKYIRIKSPFKYSQIVSRGKVILAVAAIWVTSALTAAIPLALGSSLTLKDPDICTENLSPASSVICSIISFFLPCSAMLLVYSCLYRLSRSHLRTMSALCPSARVTRDYKAALTIGLVMGAFLACWLPFFIILLLRAWTETLIPEWVFTLTNWLGYLNSAVDPFLYVMSNNEFKEVFKKIFLKQFSPNASVWSSYNRFSSKSSSISGS